MNDQTVPIQLLAAEWGISAEALASELGPGRLIIDELGVRHTTVTDARELLAQRRARAEVQRQEELERVAVIDAMGAPTRARVQALQAHQRQLFATGQVDAGADALTVMTAGENEARLGPASRRMDGYLRGVSEGHTFNPQPAARKD